MLPQEAGNQEGAESVPGGGAASQRAPQPARAGAQEKLKVFISYSRKDALAFADQLVAALAACGYAPTIDRHGIAGAEKWQERLGTLILEADTVVFVLTPESGKSDICKWEVEEADRRAKRLIPIVPHSLDGAVVSDRLRGLNYIYFHPDPAFPDAGFGHGLARLIAALDTDLDWVREGHAEDGQRGCHNGGTPEAAGSSPVSRAIYFNDLAVS